MNYLKKILISGLVVLAFTSCAEARGKHNPPPPPPPPPPPVVNSVQAISTWQFLDTLGVNTHFNYSGNNAYANTANIESELQYTGIKYARDTVLAHFPLAILQKVNAATGVKFDMLVYSGDYTKEITDLKTVPSIIEEIEGPNEVDYNPVSFGGKSGPQGAFNIQKQLWNDVNSFAAFNAIPVDSLSIANPPSYSVPNISAYCDYSSSHIYPMYGGNSNVAGALSWSINAASADTPGKPSVVTEFGWWTQPYSNGVSELVQAKDVLNFYFDAPLYNVHRSYLYELNDEVQDTSSTIEYHFGLFHANGTPKISATALRNLNAVLNASNFTPGKLAYSLSNSTNINQLLMEKSNGVFVLALWQDPVLWDSSSNRPITVANQQVLVNLNTAAKNISIIDPLAGTASSATFTSVAGFTVQVLDHPVLIFITP